MITIQIHSVMLGPPARDLRAFSGPAECGLTFRGGGQVSGYAWRMSREQIAAYRQARLAANPETAAAILAQAGFRVVGG